jgi:cation transport regulator
MPYKTIHDLPDSIKNSLPEHAQEIFLRVFNSAWDEYKDAANRRGDDSQDQVARKVAWSAVKKVYTRISTGHWVKK